MRIAFLSDIHGNAIALQAVLSDIEKRGGVDAHWVLGDLVALGPEPVGVLKQLTALSNLYATRGNTDRYVTTEARPYPSYEDVEADPSLVLRFAQIAATFAWTQGAVSAGGWFDWLNDLPLEQRTILPDGTRLLGVHAAPGTDDGDGIHDELTEAELRALLEGCDADLIVVGHTHRPLERNVDARRVANLGSVSMHVTSDKRASYALLEGDDEGYRLTRHQVAYDRAAVVTHLERLRHPGRAFIGQYLSDDP